MPRAFLVLLLVILTVPVPGFAQTGSAATSAEPFKVGTFLNGTTPLPWGSCCATGSSSIWPGANAALEKSRSAYPRRGDAG